MPHDYQRSRRVATGMIKKWGGLGAFRRIGEADRQCFIVVQDYSPMERLGKMIDPQDRLVLVAALAPDGSLIEIPPNRESDRLVTYVRDTDPPEDEEVLRFSAPPAPFAPGGVLTYWEIKVRR